MNITIHAPENMVKMQILSNNKSLLNITFIVHFLFFHFFHFHIFLFCFQNFLYRTLCFIDNNFIECAWHAPQNHITEIDPTLSARQSLQLKWLYHLIISIKVYIHWRCITLLNRFYIGNGKSNRTFSNFQYEIACFIGSLKNCSF